MVRYLRLDVECRCLRRTMLLNRDIVRKASRVEVTLEDFPNIVQMSNAFLSEEWHVVQRKMRLIPMTEGNSLQCHAGYVWVVNRKQN